MSGIKVTLDLDNDDDLRNYLREKIAGEIRGILLTESLSS